MQKLKSSISSVCAQLCCLVLLVCDYEQHSTCDSQELHKPSVLITSCKPAMALICQMSYANNGLMVVILEEIIMSAFWMQNQDAHPASVWRLIMIQIHPEIICEIWSVYLKEAESRKHAA